jgi:diaminopimelate epimerase
MTQDFASHGLRFSKAHAYGNDFLYVAEDLVAGLTLAALARALCSRHDGVGADGLIVYAPTPAGARMRLFNADGSRAEVSGNGVRALAALLLRHAPEGPAVVAIETDAGEKRLERTGLDGIRQTFRAAMGVPTGIRQVDIDAAGGTVSAVVLNIGNPQCVVLGPLPDEARFRRLGAAIERHPMFPEGTNVEFAAVEAPDRIRMLIWERGVGPTSSSGTGTCAAHVAAVTGGGAARTADVIAPGGTQRVEWTTAGLFLTGWAEVLFEGDWLGPIGS